MSVDYSNLILLETGKVTTPSDDAIVGLVWGIGYSFLVYSLEVVVITAGAQSASELFLETFDGVTALATCAMGASVAGTQLSTKVAVGSMVRSAATNLRLRHNTTDLSAVYCYKVWGTTGAC